MDEDGQDLELMDAEFDGLVIDEDAVAPNVQAEVAQGNVRKGLAENDLSALGHFALRIAYG